MSNVLKTIVLYILSRILVVSGAGVHLIPVTPSFLEVEVLPFLKTSEELFRSCFEYEIFFGISVGENLHSFRVGLILGSNQESFL